MNPLRPLAPLALLAAPALAQSPLHVFDGDSAGDELGVTVGGAGDVDGDGVGDVIVGSPGDAARAARVFSGATGAFLFGLHGATLGDGFGRYVDGAGDVDGDGVPDLVVGTEVGGGYVRAVSGATATTIHEWSPAGGPVVGLGDVNGDGRSDVAFRAGGGVQVRSGLDGALLHQLPGGGLTAIGAAGDADADGLADVALGERFEPFPSGNGVVRIYSGATGAVLATSSGGMEDWFGAAVAGVGDVDGDGRDDVAAVAEIDLTSFAGPPYVRVISGATGATLLQVQIFNPQATLGDAVVAGPGDLDGDGVPDVVCGGSGELYAISCATGDRLWTLGSSAAPYGLDATGDVDGDGASDLIVGEPQATSAGRATLRSGLCAPPPAVFCAGQPNSAGAGARLLWEGSPSLVENDLTLIATGLPAGEFSLFFYGGAAVSVPFGDGVRCVGAGAIGIHRLWPATTSSNFGTVVRQLDVTSGPLSTGAGAAVAGATFYFQLFYRDSASTGAGVNTSDGLSVTWCP